MSKRELTEAHKAFIEALFEHDGDVKAAAEEAGFSKSQGYYLVKALKDEIIETAKEILALNAPRAASTLVNALSGNKAVAPSSVEAAKQILDRSGVIKEEKIKVEGEVQGILILPSKDEH